MFPTTPPIGKLKLNLNAVKVFSSIFTTLFKTFMCKGTWTPFIGNSTALALLSTKILPGWRPFGKSSLLL